MRAALVLLACLGLAAAQAPGPAAATDAVLMHQLLQLQSEVAVLKAGAQQGPAPPPAAARPPPPAQQDAAAPLQPVLAPASVSLPPAAALPLAGPPAAWQGWVGAKAQQLPQWAPPVQQQQQQQQQRWEPAAHPQQAQAPLQQLPPMGAQAFPGSPSR